MAAYMDRADHDQWLITIGHNDDFDRAERILTAAVLQINDRVIELYKGETAPHNVSELEKGNYDA